MRTWLAVPALMALAGCTPGAQGLIEALGSDPATACATVQTPWGSASILRSNPALPAGFDGTAEVSVTSGACNMKLTTASKPQAPVVIVTPAP